MICKKIFCHMHEKRLKYFGVMFNILEFFHMKEIVESWLVYVNKFS